jgi:hypothetical protein
MNSKRVLRFVATRGFWFGAGWFLGIAALYMVKVCTLVS